MLIVLQRKGKACKTKTKEKEWLNKLYEKKFCTELMKKGRESVIFHQGSNNKEKRTSSKERRKKCGEENNVMDGRESVTEMMKEGKDSA